MGRILAEPGRFGTIGHSRSRGSVGNPRASIRLIGVPGGKPLLKLRGAFTDNPRVGPLLDGSIQPRDCEISWEAGDMGVMAARHMREDAFDVFEFSISDYFAISQRSDTRWDWIGLPVFLSKA